MNNVPESSNKDKEMMAILDLVDASHDIKDLDKLYLKAQLLLRNGYLSDAIDMLGEVFSLKYDGCTETEGNDECARNLKAVALSSRARNSMSFQACNCSVNNNGMIDGRWDIDFVKQVMICKPCSVLF